MQHVRQIPTTLRYYHALFAFQRNCLCLYRDPINVERFARAIQCMSIICVKNLKNLHNLFKQQNKSDPEENEPKIEKGDAAVKTVDRDGEKKRQMSQVRLMNNFAQLTG